MSQVHDFTYQTPTHDYLFVPYIVSLDDPNMEGVHGQVLGWHETETILPGDVLCLGRVKDIPSFYRIDYIQFHPNHPKCLQFVAEVTWVAETQVEATLKQPVSDKPSATAPAVLKPARKKSHA